MNPPNRTSDASPVFEPLEARLLLSATIGSEGAHWPPFPESPAWYVENPAEESDPWLVGEAIPILYSYHDDPNNNDTWDLGEGANLFTQLFAKVAIIGTAGISRVHEVRQALEVDHTGEYRVQATVLIDQSVSINGFSFAIGDHSNSYAVRNRFGIYLNDLPYAYDDSPLLSDHEQIEGFGDALGDSGWALLSSAHGSLKSFADYDVGKFTPVLPGVIDLIEVLYDIEDWGVQDDATFAATYNLDLVTHLEAGVQYELRAGTDAGAVAQCFLTAGGAATSVIVDMWVGDISIDLLQGNAEIIDSDGANTDRSIAFGDVPLSQSRTEHVTIRNTGTDDLTITSWIVDHPAFQLAPSNPTGATGDIILGPSEETQVDITFAPQSQQPYTGTLVIITDDPDSPTATVTLSGTGVQNQSDADLVVNPSSGQMGSAFTATATVRDAYGNTVGAGQEVHFSTLMAGVWGSYHHTGDGGFYELTDAAGQARVTFTPSQIGPGSITATSEIGGTDVASFNVTAPSLNFESEVTMRGNDGIAASYTVQWQVTDLSGNPIRNADVEFEITDGTVTGKSTLTGDAGHAHVDVATTQAGPATATIILPEFGVSNSVGVTVMIGPVASFPVGKAIGANSATAGMALNPQGTRIATASGSDITIIDVATSHTYNSHRSHFEGTDIADIAVDSGGTRIMVVSRSRRMAIYSIGSSNLSVIREWENDSSLGMGDGLSVRWVSNRFIVGHDATSTKPYDLSAWTNGGGYSSKYSSGDSLDIISIAARPGTSTFAALSQQDDIVFTGSSGSLGLSAFKTFDCEIDGTMAWSPDGAYLVISPKASNRTPQIFTSGGSAVATLQNAPGGVRHAAFSSDGNYLVIGVGTTVDIYQKLGTWSNPSHIYRASMGQSCTDMGWLPGTHTIVASGSSQVQFICLGDTTPPSISISSPADGYRTPSETVTVTGEVTDASGIQSVTIRVNDGTPESLTLDGSGHFSYPVNLTTPGAAHTVTIEATDNTGWRNADAVAVTRTTDEAGPIVANIGIAPSTGVRPGEQVTIAATVIDADSGVDDASVHALVQLPDETDVAVVVMTRASGDRFEGVWNTSGYAAGTYRVDVIARDVAENETELENAGAVIVNAPPSISVLAPASDVTARAGDLVTVDLSAGDADSEAITSVFLDTDKDPDNGVIAVPGGIGLPEPTTQVVIDPSDFPLGNYWVYAVATDEYSQAAAWSSGRIIIENAPPTDIVLSASSVAENRVIGAVVGSLSTTDPDAGATHTYELAPGPGGEDNDSFTIADNRLKTAESFDYEAKNSYSIRVRSTDQGGLWTEKVFPIQVTDVDDAPVWIPVGDDHWENSANWSTGVVPGATDAAVFEQAATHQPALYQDESIKGLDFRTAGWTLSCNDHTLTVGEGGITFAGGGAPTSTIDLGMGNLVVDYDGASPHGEIADMIRSGLNLPGGGNWDGQGITSSAAAGHPQGLTAVGVIDNGDTETGIGGLTEFGGVAVDETCVLAACTWWGDVNLDGVVDSNDYDRIDTNYVRWINEGRVPDGGWRWAVGDLDYDKMIDSNDYDLIDKAFLLQHGPTAAGGAASVAGPDPLPLTASSPKARDLTEWPEVALVAGPSERQPVWQPAPGPADLLPALATISTASDGSAGEVATALAAESADLAAPPAWSPLPAHTSADADIAAIDSLFNPLALPALDIRL